MFFAMHLVVGLRRCRHGLDESRLVSLHLMSLQLCSSACRVVLFRVRPALLVQTFKRPLLSLAEATETRRSRNMRQKCSLPKRSFRLANSCSVLCLGLQMMTIAPKRLCAVKV